jgi:hypothetical protein
MLSLAVSIIAKPAPKLITHDAITIHASLGEYCDATVEAQCGRNDTYAMHRDHLYVGAVLLAPIPANPARATSTSCATVPPLTPTPPISLPS